jgi:transposase
MDHIFNVRTKNKNALEKIGELFVGKKRRKDKIEYVIFINKKKLDLWEN